MLYEKKDNEKEASFIYRLTRFLFRPYGTCHINRLFFYRYYVPNGTTCEPANEGRQIVLKHYGYT